MVGLATIADMVPLVGENRVLATYGFKSLAKIATHRPSKTLPSDPSKPAAHFRR